MKRVLRIAKTELLEHRRQPWMLFILAANYLLWSALFIGLFVLLAGVFGSPEALARFKEQLTSMGVEFDTFLKLATSTFGSLQFTNLPLFVAIMSGTSVLHDRESGTMPFLMLAPITRRQLLLGKLLGAMAIPLVMHLVFVGAGSFVLSRIGFLEPHAYKFGAAPAWWVSFLLGAPASAALVGAMGTVISALSRDTRTSMQFTSFFIGLLSLGIGYVLIDGIPQGVAAQVSYAVGCLVGAALTLGVGANLISTDLTS